MSSAEVVKFYGVTKNANPGWIILAASLSGGLFRQNTLSYSETKRMWWRFLIIVKENGFEARVPGKRPKVWPRLNISAPFSGLENT